MDGSRNDFNTTVQQVTFQPSTGNVDENININLVDDIINEAQEGFFVVIEVVQSGAGDQINFVRNGVALIRINDNDGKQLNFISYGIIYISLIPLQRYMHDNYSMHDHASAS